MTDRTFIFSIAVIKKMATKILIRELKFKIYYFDEFDIIIFYIKRVLSNDTRAFAEIIKEIYIIDDLKADIFINIDIFISKRIIIDFAIQSITIESYRNITILMNSRVRFESIKRTIKLAA